MWPTKHGILANTTFDPLGKNQSGWYWYAEDIKVPTLWDVARQAGMTTASIQWPVSVGARVTWNIPRSGAPTRTRTPKLLEPSRRRDSCPSSRRSSGPYPRGQDIEHDERRGSFATRLLEEKRPQLLTLHLLALDHVEHETGPLSRRASPSSSGRTPSSASCATPPSAWLPATRMWPSCPTTAS